MNDPRVDNLAKILVNYSVDVQPGDRVLLNGAIVALPLVKEVYRQILMAGGHPLIIMQDDALTEIEFSESNDEQLRHIPEPLKQVYETYDCFISVRAASNTRSLTGIDPSRQRITQEARRELAGKYMQRAAEGDARWVVTLYPTNAHAQEADMSLTDYEDFVFSACFADKDDPISEWRAVSTEQDRLVKWLAGKDQVVAKGTNIDLTLSISGRKFINADGRSNMPDGEIFTGPVEESVSGWIKYSYPAIVSGREVSGIELFFEDGKVVKATAEKNEDFLLQMLDMDEGARYVGEFAIGTNMGIQKFTKSILYDEKIGGTLHMALGRGYPETGSKNTSGIHWDMICDMRNGAEIVVDGELFYRSGEFMV
jgi:aminopeptidase